VRPAGRIADIHCGQQENALDGQDEKSGGEDGEQAVASFLPKTQEKISAGEEPDHDPAGKELADQCFHVLLRIKP